MTLRSVYEDPATTSLNATILAERAGTTVKAAKAFLKTQATAQAEARWTKPTSTSTLAHSAYAPTGAPAGHWQADVIAFELLKGANIQRKFILTVLHTTSRVAYARGLTSRKAPIVAAAFTDILTVDKPDITVLRVDGGSEFKSVFATLLRTRGISLELAEAFTHYKLSRTDRFHRTLRQKIGAYFALHKTNNWVAVLPAIISNYNKTPHSTLTAVLSRSASPLSVSAADEIKIRAAERTRSADVGRRTDELGFVPGTTRVRILFAFSKAALKAGGSFRKKGLAPTWSESSYLVSGRAGVNSWFVDTPANEIKLWPSYALRVVGDEEEVVVKKKDKRVNLVAAGRQRLQTLEISEEEQAAAIAAPANPRGQRAPRVDYKKLAAGM